MESNNLAIISTINSLDEKNLELIKENLNNIYHYKDKPIKKEIEDLIDKIYNQIHMDIVRGKNYGELQQMKKTIDDLILKNKKLNEKIIKLENEDLQNNLKSELDNSKKEIVLLEDKIKILTDENIQLKDKNNNSHKLEKILYESLKKKDLKLKEIIKNNILKIKGI